MSEFYTLYDYIEVFINGEAIQFRDLYVSDPINTGLVLGSTADLVIGNYYEYRTLTTATEISELFSIRTSEVERSNYSEVIRELENKPTILGFIPWLLGLPIRAISGSSRSGGGLGLLLGVVLILYWVVIFSPVVAPFTYVTRVKRHRILREKVRLLIGNISSEKSEFKRQLELKEASDCYL